MSPANHVLAGYLKTIAGFSYENANLDLPKHYLANGVFLNTTAPTADRLKEPLPGSWALIKKGLYRQDVGLVIKDTFNEARSSQRIIIVVPRLKLPSLEPANLKNSEKNRTRQRRPKTPLESSSHHAVAERFGVSVQLICRHKSCAKRTPEECLHSDKRYRLFGQVIDASSGFVVLRKSIHDIEEAVTIADRDLALFKQHLGKDFPHSSPRPQSWCLVASDRIEVNGRPGIANGALGEIVSTEARSCTVRLDIEDAEYIVAYHLLRKALKVGDVVGVPRNIPALRQLHQNLIPDSGLAHIEVEDVQVPPEGFVVAVTDDTVDVYLEDLNVSITLHRNSVRFITVANTASYPSQMSLLPKQLPSPVKWRDCFGVINQSALEVISRLTHSKDYGKGLYTGQTPYVGLSVILLGENAMRGQRMTVQGMRADPKFRSGLGVLLRVDIIQGVATQDHEYDYDDVRRADNHRFLHDLTPTAGLSEPIRKMATGTNSYFNFKLGYVPTYTAREVHDFGMVSLFVSPQAPMAPPAPPSLPSQPSLMPSIEGVSGSTPRWVPEEIEELRSGADAWNASSRGYWFANPQLRESLAGLDVMIATVGGLDKRVQICTSDGDIIVKEVSMTRNQRQYGSNIDPSEISKDICTWDVGDASTSQHLFVVVRGLHVGQFCRRVGRELSPMHDHREWNFALRAILLAKSTKRGSNTWVETLDSKFNEVFYVHKTDLLVIAISGSQQKQGRALVTDLQKSYGT